ncbi:MAG: DUF456 domain-containing protein [Treponema sp.]|nr:DUF456 domain-containing protein [Treponema sp.]
MSLLLFDFFSSSDSGLYFAAWAFLVLGIIGAVLPVLPGPPLSWVGLLIGSFLTGYDISVTKLVITGIIAAAITVADYILPSYLTKVTGGTKAGSWGATIGLICGLFLGPFGILIGPFAGALIAEIIHDSNDFSKALKSACGAFLGFIAGTGLKLICDIAFIFVFVKSRIPDEVIQAVV